MNPMQTEPVLTVGTIANFVAAGVALAIAFGAPLTSSQQDALLGFVPAAFLFIQALLVVIRQLVYAPATVAKEKAASFEAGLEAAGGTSPVAGGIA